MVRNRYILFAFRLIVGGVFIWSGILKAIHPLDFAQNVSAYKVFPGWMSLAIAACLPWVETAAGVLLVGGLFRRGAALVTSGMLAGFIILVAGTMARGLDLTCGCFGSLSGRVGWPLLVQDIVLLYLSLNLLLSSRSFAELDPSGREFVSKPPNSGSN